MLEYILDMGPFGLLNVVILAVILIIALKNAYLLYIRRTPENLPGLGRSINTMLFWGAMVVVLGLLGALVGMQTGTDSILASGTRDFRVMLGGLSMILKLVVFSLACFTVISIVWFAFTGRHRKLLEQAMREQYGEQGAPQTAVGTLHFGSMQK